MAVEANLLSTFQSLNDWSERDRKMMAAQLVAERFRTGAQICREGDDGECCWFLVDGRIGVTKVLPDGRKVKLAELPAGTHFGQSGLIPGQKRTAEVRAETDVLILKLPRSGLEWSLKRGDAWASRLQIAVAVDLVRQLRSALSRLSDLATAEDPSLAAEGRTKASIPQAQSLDVALSPRQRPVAAPSGPTGATRYTEPEPVESGFAPRPSGGMGDLLQMLQETEASLASSGMSLEAVEFVYDEDQRRTGEARAAKGPSY